MIGIVFPARAGMSRVWQIKGTITGRFPHTRGDEPPAAWAAPRSTPFSPHARG